MRFVPLILLLFFVLTTFLSLSKKKTHLLLFFVLLILSIFIFFFLGYQTPSASLLGPSGLDFSQTFFKPIHNASPPSATNRYTKIFVVGTENVCMVIAQTILTQELADEIALVDVNTNKLCDEMLNL